MVRDRGRCRRRDTCSWQTEYVCASKQSARNWVNNSLVGERQASTRTYARVQKWKARSVSVPQTARGRWKFSDTRKDVLTNKLMLPLSFLLSPFPPKVVRQTCTRLQSLSHSVSGIRQPFSLSDVCPASLPRDVCCSYGWIPPSSGHSVYSTNAKVPLSLSLSHSIVDGCLPKIAHLSILPPSLSA